MHGRVLRPGFGFCDWVPFYNQPEERNGWLLYASDREDAEALCAYYGFRPCKARNCVRKARSEYGLCWPCWKVRYEPWRGRELPKVLTSFRRPNFFRPYTLNPTR